MNESKHRHCAICHWETQEFSGEENVVQCNVREFQDQFFRVWRCPECDSLHCLEKVDLDLYYRNYPLKQQKKDFLTKKILNNRMKGMIRNGVSREDRILDYGCANGFFVEILRENGFSAVGYDPFNEGFQDPGILSKKFDVVTSQDVIEHDDDPLGLLAKMTALVKPGGKLIIGTPEAVGIRLDRPDLDSMQLHQPYHRHIFSKKALIQSAESLGLVPVDVDEGSYFDTPYPFANTRFLMNFVRENGNVIDCAFEPIAPKQILGSPKNVAFGLFGSLMPPKGLVSMVFDKM